MICSRCGNVINESDKHYEVESTNTKTHAVEHYHFHPYCWNSLSIVSDEFREEISMNCGLTKRY